MNYGFVIDNRKCIGCHACTVACKAEHDVPLGVNRTWVKYIEKGTFPDTRRFFSVMRCNHCENAPCVTICPVTALYTREDGIVDFDPNRCIGCKACIQGCPYDALYIDPNSNTAAKCNYCAHRVEVSLEPPCAVVCPEHAIIAGDMDDPTTEIAHIIKMEELTVRKPEKGTRPKVFYVNGDRASLVPGETSVPDAYVWSQGREPGVLPERPASGAGPGILSDDLWERVRAAVGEKADRARRVYDAGQTHQDSWGWKVSAYMWTKSIAAGCLMLAPFLWGWGNRPYEARLRLSALILSLLFLAVTGVLLVSDLKRPDRFLWVITRPQWGSWLTRGSYILLAFGVIAAALTAAQYAGWRRVSNLLAVPAVLAGAAGAAYTAFLFWQAKGRDLWQSSLLPLHLVVQALAAGLSTMLLVRAASPGPLPLDDEGFFETWLWRALALNAALIALELFAIHPTEDAASAALWARTGSRWHALTWGVAAAGHAAPLALLYVDNDAARGAAALLALAGLAIYEHLYVRAGQSVALS
ncbi:MAG TPA: 4Fe-4S dicluster domain-containing protein [Candidatus Polarisedimenticolia bacterium]|jgi:Fe-S-cluster-containing dehydrogenase component/formate-dependent nitrite reductase membrane component NrfD